MDPNSGAVQPVNGGPQGGGPYSQMVNPPNMAMVTMNNIMNVKDSRWLQLEVCREFQRNKCTRPDTECKFAHPPPNVEVQNGRVTACYDSIKGRCNREKPPCKYFHPPQHLKDQLLINGRNHLALKNALMTQIHGLPPTTSVMPGTLQMPTASPYLQGIPTMGGFGPYLASSSPVMTMGVNDGMTSQLTGVLPQHMVAAQKLPRTDRLETFPGVLPYKRTATEKSGVPMFQPGNAAYQQALMQQLGTQTYVPVSCEYGGSQPTAAAAAAATNAPLSDNSVPPRTTTTSPTVTEIITASSTNTPTSNSSSTSSSSNSHNALVPVNSSKDSVAMASSSQALSLPHHSHAVAAPALNNVFSYAGYALNNKAVRQTFRGPMYSVQPPPSVGLPAYGYSQPPPHSQGMGVSYVNNLGSNVSVAGVMPYAAQAPTFVTAGGMAAAAAAAASGMHGISAAYPGLPAGVTAGTTAMQPQQFMYPSPPYHPMSNFVMPQPTTALSGASPQFNWAAAAQAAAAAAGSTEQPYKKLKTV